MNVKGIKINKEENVASVIANGNRLFNWLSRYMVRAFCSPGTVHQASRQTRVDS